MNRKDFLLNTFIFSLTLLNTPKKISALGTQSHPKNGNLAPDFQGIAIGKNKNEIISLNSYRGSWVVLYFYPKDFTSGCTLEARGFKKNNISFNKMNTRIIGISADSKEDHESFCEKEDLKYNLVSDKDGTISKTYGSWNDPYSSRNTFLINPNGVIKARWIGVKPINHAQEVLTELTKLQ